MSAAQRVGAVVRRALVGLSAASLGLSIGVALQTNADDLVPATPVACADAVTYADQLVTQYADAYAQALQRRLNDTQVAHIQDQLSATGRAYVTRRNTCEVTR